MEFNSDNRGNKYFSFEEDDDSYQYEINKIGNKLDDFEILQILSEKNNNSDQSFVAKVRSLNNNKIYSLKKLNIEVKDFQTKQKIFNFLDKLKSINHPHIIKYFNYFEDNNFIYVIMEYINNSDILGYIQGYQILGKEIPETEIWNILLQCLSALNYLNYLNYRNIGIKMNNIFINNMYNIKIAVFRDFIFNVQNNSPNEEIEFLLKFIYTMINSQFYTVEDLDNKKFIDYLELKSFEQANYSSELRNILNNMYEKIISKQQINISSIYENTKNEYSKKFTKNTSINAIIKCLYSYKFLYDRISEKRGIIENNEEKYFMNYWYLKAMDALNGKDENNLQRFSKEFRIALANTYSKLDGNKEIDPLIVLIFILDKMHKELNVVDNNFIQNSWYTQYINNKNDMKNYALNGEEQDRTNKNQMREEYLNYFSATMNSPISNLFVGFIKTKSLCQNCKSGYYSFSNYLYCVFDLSELESENNFNLIQDGFRKNKNTSKEIDENSPNKIWCERCQTYEKFKEFNRFYTISNHLIIVFFRGKNYSNNSKIIFDEKINLKEFIEPNTNTPSNFYLVGSVNRKIQNDVEEYVPYFKEQNNENNWRTKGFDEIQKNNNEQIIMLFYNSKD